MLSFGDLTKPSQSGQAQILKMFTEFPQMRSALSIDGEVIPIKKNSLPFEAVENLLSTKLLGKNISWEVLEGAGDSPYLANHSIPSLDKKGVIRLRRQFLDHKGVVRPPTFEECWHATIFELYNIRSYVEFKAVTRDAYAGKVTENEWVKKNLKIEYSNLLKARQFYHNKWKKWTKDNQIPSREEIWDRTAGLSANDWIALQKGKDWRNFFKKNIKPVISKSHASPTIVK